MKVNTLQKQFQKLPKIWGVLLVFGGIMLLALKVNSIGSDWERELLIEEANNSVTSEYFYYSGLHFQKGYTMTQTFSGSESIDYISERTFYRHIDSLSFGEDIYIDKDFDGVYDNGKVVLPRDLDNEKYPKKKEVVLWTLGVTCENLGVGRYKVEHTIWATLVNDIRKYQTLYTYFSCIEGKQ